VQRNAIMTVLSLACGGTFLAACADQPTSPAALPGDPAVAASGRAAQLAAANVVTLQSEPFLVRAPLDPYFINQAPDFMIRSRDRTDLVIQRLVAPPGPGGWHTHPGPSFGIVEQGQVMITRYSKKHGCTSEVYGPGEAYFEVADEVHRVTVLGPDDAVEYKARFNTPVGEPFGNPASDPGC
jgi:hypothetical protein